MRTRVQNGFILPTGMVFLLIMTVLAITAIQRATIDEKVAGNLRVQTQAFQATETALRYCQKDLENTAPGHDMRLTPGTTQTVGGIPINPYPSNIVLPPTGSSPMPILWQTIGNWTPAQSYTLPNNTVPNVVAQPQCMIEEWIFLKNPMPKQGSKVWVAYLITARGVGSTANSVVWLQTAFRLGTTVN